MNISSLPRDVLDICILSLLDTTSRVMCRCTCKRWRSLITNKKVSFKQIGMYGYLNILKLFLSNEKRLKPVRAQLLINTAAEFGNIEILKYVKEHTPLIQWGNNVNKSIYNIEHLPINKNICFLAVKHGQIDVVKWAKNNGSPLTDRYYRAAMMINQDPKSMILYLKQEGCPFDKQKVIASASFYNPSLIPWLETLF